MIAGPGTAPRLKQMSIISSFFVGTHQEALENDGLEGGPAERCIPLRNVGLMEISSLGEHLTGGACDLGLVVSDEDEGIFTMSMPQNFVEALQGTDIAKAQALVDTWIKEGEPIEERSPQELHAFVMKLVDLAKRVPEYGERMYYFTTV